MKSALTEDLGYPCPSAMKESDYWLGGSIFTGYLRNMQPLSFDDLLGQIKGAIGGAG